MALKEVSIYLEQGMESREVECIVEVKEQLHPLGPLLLSHALAAVCDLRLHRCLLLAQVLVDSWSIGGIEPWSQSS